MSQFNEMVCKLASEAEETLRSFERLTQNGEADRFSLEQENLRLKEFLEGLECLSSKMKEVGQVGNRISELLLGHVSEGSSVQQRD